MTVWVNVEEEKDDGQILIITTYEYILLVQNEKNSESQYRQNLQNVEQ